ncbi:hypothetical protein AB0G35_06035 [Streptomyces sp. NPDC021749]|uniref:hypothetical protein n=1 Tax=Streptomyces sp. NPDC021749 TaxID=3154905 RepID=UPI0033D565C6
MAGRAQAETGGGDGSGGRVGAVGRRPGAAQRGAVHDQVGAGGGEQLGSLVGP